MALPFVNFTESLPAGGQIPCLVHRDHIISIEACEGAGAVRSFTNGCTLTLINGDIKLVSSAETANLLRQIGWWNLL